MCFFRFVSLISLVFLLMLMSSAPTQAASLSLDWVHTVGGEAYNDIGRSIRTDNDGNIYVIGEFGDASVDLNPQAGEDLATNIGDKSGFLSKYSSSGEYQWSKVISALDEGDFVQMFDLEVDMLRNRIYIVGNFVGVFDFDPGEEVASSTSDTQAAFLLVLDGSGEYIDHKYIVGAGDGFSGNFSSTAYAVEVDNSGNVYYAGILDGSSQGDVTFNLNPDGDDLHTTTYSGIDSDFFLIKYESDLSYEWSRVVEGDGRQLLTSLQLTDEGALYIGGRFSGVNIDFDPTDGVDTHSALGGYDAFVSRYSTSGEYQWTNTFGSAAYQEVTALAIDSANNVYAVGEFGGQDVDFDPSEGVDLFSSDIDEYDSAFLTSYAPDGQYRWSRIWDGSEWETALVVSVTDDDKIIVGSNVGSASIDLDGTEGEHIVTREGEDGDVYPAAISMYDTEGNFGFGYLLAPTSDEYWFTGLESRGSKLYFSAAIRGTDIDLGIDTNFPFSSVNDSDDALFGAFTVDSSMAGDDDNEDEDDGDDEDSGSSSSSRSRSRSSKPKAPTCTAEDPTSAPDLFQIDTENGSATLYFSPASGKVSGYHVSYGFIPGVYLFGDSFSVGSNDGVQTHTINHLMPFLTYNFRVMAVNGCAPGPWSQDLSGKVNKSGKQSYYFYQ